MTYDRCIRIVPPQPPLTDGWLTVNLVTRDVAPLRTEEDVKGALWPAGSPGSTQLASREETVFATMAAEWRTRGWRESIDQLLVDRAIRERWNAGDEFSRPKGVPALRTTGSPTQHIHQALRWAISPFNTRQARLGVALRGFGVDGEEGWTGFGSAPSYVASVKEEDRQALFGAFRAPFDPRWVAVILGIVEPLEGKRTPQSEAFFAAGSVFRRIEVAVEATGTRAAAHYGFDDDYLASLLGPDGSRQPLLSVAISEVGTR